MKSKGGKHNEVQSQQDHVESMESLPQDKEFAEALHRAWLSAKAEEINAKRIEDAKHAAGITEETNTFAKWKELGYKVQHGASALFGCSLIWGSRGDGATYKASFFGKSQVEAI